MKRKRDFALAGLCLMVIVALASGVAMAKGTMTITGTVNDEYQIVTDDGQVYEVGQNEKGDEVVDLVDKRVKATGMIEESEGEKTINIVSYEVVEE